VHGTGSAGAVTGLPKELRTALDAQFSGNKIK
jgi:hypothetical protein